MTTEELLNKIDVLLKADMPEVPSAEETRAIATAEAKARKERKKNKELKKIIQEINENAGLGYFSIGESIYIEEIENVDLLLEAGYVVTAAEGPNGEKGTFYDVSWEAETAESEVTA
jgi:hypothetical protein